KLQICFQANPRDLDTLGLLARAFTQIGQAAKAIEVHKEMARIARDTGRKELFGQLVTKLMKLAPNDEGVRQLMVASDPPPASDVPPMSQMPPRRPPLATDGEDGYEDVRDGDIEDEGPAEVVVSSTYPPEADVHVETIDVEDDEPPVS